MYSWVSRQSTVQDVYLILSGGCGRTSFTWAPALDPAQFDLGERSVLRKRNGEGEGETKKRGPSESGEKKSRYTVTRCFGKGLRWPGCTNVGEVFPASEVERRGVYFHARSLLLRFACPWTLAVKQRTAELTMWIVGSLKTCSSEGRLVEIVAPLPSTSEAHRIDWRPG